MCSCKRQIVIHFFLCKYLVKYYPTLLGPNKYHYIALFNARRTPIPLFINKAINAGQLVSINGQPFQGDEIVSNVQLFDDINHKDNLHIDTLSSFSNEDDGDEGFSESDSVNNNESGDKKYLSKSKDEDEV